MIFFLLLHWTLLDSSEILWLVPAPTAQIDYKQPRAIDKMVAHGEIIVELNCLG